MKTVIFLAFFFLQLFGANIQQISNEKVYKVGIIKNWEPYYVATDPKKPTGYAVELFEALAEKINLRYEYIIAEDWDSLWNLVEQKQIDIIPNVGIALNRSQLVNFTQVTDVFEIGLFENKNTKNPNETKTKNIGVVEKNVCTKLIDENLYNSKFTYKTFYKSLDGLTNGEIDLLCYPRPIVQYFIKDLNLKHITFSGEPLKIVNRAIGIIKDEPQLVDLFDKEILRIKANGEYQKIYNDWLGEKKDIEIDYVELLIILAFLLIVILFALFYIRSKDLLITKHELNQKIDQVDNLHKRLFLAADEALAGYWEWHLDTNYLFLSQGWKRYLGYEDHELKNDFETFQFVMHPDDFEPTMQIVNDYINKKIPSYSAKFRLRHKDGSYKWTSAIGVISKKDTNIFFGFHIDIDDLTTTKEMLMAQSKAAMMGDMIGLIAHQFKQPLSVISLISSNQVVSLELEKEITHEMIRDDSKQILEQVNYLNDTINTFRNFLKPNQEKRESNINDIMESSLNIVEKSLQNNDIKVVKHYDDNLPKISVNYSELMQVFINIINNAKDAFKDNHIEDGVIEITTYVDDLYVVVEIEDNAGGIDDAHIEKIFEAYFTTKENLGGTGLGLYIVKTIIEEHYKGSIEVKNTKEGAKFSILIKNDQNTH